MFTKAKSPMPTLDETHRNRTLRDTFRAHPLLISLLLATLLLLPVVWLYAPDVRRALEFYAVRARAKAANARLSKIQHTAGTHAGVGRVLGEKGEGVLGEGMGGLAGVYQGEGEDEKDGKDGMERNDAMERKDGMERVKEMKERVKEMKAGVKEYKAGVKERVRAHGAAGQWDDAVGH